MTDYGLIRPVDIATLGRAMALQPTDSIGVSYATLTRLGLSVPAGFNGFVQAGYLQPLAVALGITPEIGAAFVLSAENLAIASAGSTATGAPRGFTFDNILAGRAVMGLPSLTPAQSAPVDRTADDAEAAEAIPPPDAVSGGSMGGGYVMVLAGIAALLAIWALSRK